MITPRIELKNYDTTNKLATAIDAHRLFGRIVLAAETPTGGSLNEILKLKSGFCDIELEMPIEDLGVALEYLNVGASAIVCRDTDRGIWEKEIPTARLFTIADSDSPSSRCYLPSPAESDTTNLVEMVRRRAPFVVDATWLEANPDFAPEIIGRCLKSDRADGLWPTLIVDPIGTALGLAYSNQQSLNHAFKTRNATYWSRSRNELWEKGKTSGATQKLLTVRLDCDSDCLRFQVEQTPPGFCHLETYTCFGEERSIQAVIHRLAERIQGADAKSFTRKLANDPEMLEAKLLEEAQELADAEEPNDICWEAADVLYFSLVKIINNNVGLENVFAELARRMNRVVRRKNKLETDPPTDSDS